MAVDQTDPSMFLKGRGDGRCSNSWDTRMLSVTHVALPPSLRWGKGVVKSRVRFVVWFSCFSTIWLFNIAMENGQFIDGLPIKNCDFPWLC